TNEVNQHHIITATVMATPTGGGNLAPAGNAPVVFTVTGATANIQYTDPNADGDNNPLTATTDASGHATLQLTSTVAGTITVNGSATFSVSGVTLTRNTAGNSGPGGSGAASKTFVDGNTTLRPLTATNQVNHHHIVTATVKKD